MPTAINLKTVTADSGLGMRSKTSTFGLKFVTVPMPAASAAIWRNRRRLSSA